MALQGKLEAQVDLKSSADKYFNLWRKEQHKIPAISSSNVQGLDLHEGDWDSHGAVKSWAYTVEGKAEIFKETVEYDDANLSFTVHGSEGHVFDQYKVFKPSCKLIRKDDQGCTAVLMIEYEKLNEDVPAPNKYLEFFTSLTKDIDAHASEA